MAGNFQVVGNHLFLNIGVTWPNFKLSGNIALSIKWLKNMLSDMMCLHDFKTLTGIASFVAVKSINGF